MSKQVTIDRVLRDDDDASGKTVRSWRIEHEGDTITMSSRKGDAGAFCLIRVTDLATFVADLYEAAGLRAIPVDLAPKDRHG